MTELHQLPPEVLLHIRGYASDRVQAHPTAPLIKELAFYHDTIGHPSFNVHSLSVYGDLTIRERKCSDRDCRTCVGSGSCRNARDVTRRVGCRRYLQLDFMEPDRLSAFRSPANF